MNTDNHRKELLQKLSRNFMISVPVMTVVAMAGATAVSDHGPGLIPSAEAGQGEAEGEAHSEAEGEAEGKSEGEGEGEGEAQGEGEAEGEGEGISEKMKAAVQRPSDYQPHEGDARALAEKGKALFSDTSLSTNGLSCQTCHANGAGYADTFSKDYPHSVEMAKTDFGLDQVTLDEMVQVCMVAPMAAQPLEWDSEELAALTEYMRVEQENFRQR
ncbi:Di-haem cytochrome c peroxidase [Marinobacter daqiaonensis]|uniref:Di-haem cytochrome c peroxidase n=1 Tax=Marinobacter daqiaonensis TaxID=650891 RepID=A0A1I6IHL1_9GAMM|nr:cytochrome c peroxidase [Marinobacter daqiaonensis]SFR66287.1 Di-haem cytochrome c peroxidase [Marinobacter daqiaonensis]